MDLARNRIIKFLLLVCLAACSQVGEEVGLWDAVGDEGSIEFKSSGEVIVTDSMESIVMGNYRREGDDRIVIEFTASNIFEDDIKPMDAVEILASIRVTGDELTLSHEGEAEVYHRAK